MDSSIAVSSYPKPPKNSSSYAASVDTIVSTEISGRHTAVITQNHRLYKRVCANAKRIYTKELGVTLSAFPPTFVALLEKEEPIAGIGMTVADNRLLTAERYFPNQNLSEMLGVSRSQICEFGTLHVLPIEERERMTLSVIESMFFYAHQEGMKYGIVTIHRACATILRRMGVDAQEVGTPDPTLLYSGEELKMWTKRYFRLGVKTFSFDIPQAALAQKDENLRVA